MRVHAKERIIKSLNGLVKLNGFVGERRRYAQIRNSVHHRLRAVLWKLYRVWDRTLV